MTYEQKLLLYRAGMYLIPPPPVPHEGWGESAWISYIDAHGAWRVNAATTK